MSPRDIMIHQDDYFPNQMTYNDNTSPSISRHSSVSYGHMGFSPVGERSPSYIFRQPSKIRQGNNLGVMLMSKSQRNQIDGTATLLQPHNDSTQRSMVTATPVGMLRHMPSSQRHGSRSPSSQVPNLLGNAGVNNAEDKSLRRGASYDGSSNTSQYSGRLGANDRLELLEGVVPPINVLIVEDNPINQKILEAFMKKRNIRSDNAKNGLEAVKKWKTGGFHLILMDIQLPIMSGLEATKEIRRLERVNHIGVLWQCNEKSELVSASDKIDPRLFKSPVIIVALTASSLNSDRHEALAAGCNDFLTKPVSFVWLERKITEWGCMQALIDFDEWKVYQNQVKGSQIPNNV